jgi:hypothetical protein
MLPRDLPDGEVAEHGGDSGLGNSGNGGDTGGGNEETSLESAHWKRPFGRVRCCKGKRWRGAYQRSIEQRKHQESIPCTPLLGSQELDVQLNVGRRRSCEKDSHDKHHCSEKAPVAGVFEVRHHHDLSVLLRCSEAHGTQTI